MNDKRERNVMDELIFGPVPEGNKPPKLHPMDEYILRRLGRLPIESTEETPEPGAQTGLSEAQAARIEKLMALAGASYTEARDLVLSAPPAAPPVPIPPGNAGAGTGTLPPASETLGDIIDRALSRGRRG